MRPKNDSLEGNAYKNNVRLEIAKQQIEDAKNKGLTEYHVVCMSGENWLAEKILIEEGKKVGIKVTGVGFEYSTTELASLTWETMRDNCPDGFIAINRPVSEWADYETKPFNSGWFDFCGYPEKERRQVVKDFVQTHPDSLTYSTFSMHIRSCGGEAFLSKKVWPWGNETLNIREATLKRLWFDVRYKCKHKDNISQIFKVLYCGGEVESTGMQTIGYQSSAGKTVTAFNEDWEQPIRQARAIKNKIIKVASDKDKEKISSFLDMINASSKGATEQADVLDAQIKILLQQVSSLVNDRDEILDECKKTNPLRFCNNDEFIRGLCRNGYSREQIWEACKKETLAGKRSWYNDKHEFHTFNQQAVFMPTKKKIAALTTWETKKMKKAA